MHSATILSALYRRPKQRRLVLFHHDPRRTDDELDEIARSLESAAVPVTVAREGTSLELDSGAPCNEPNVAIFP